MTGRTSGASGHFAIWRFAHFDLKTPSGLKLQCPSSLRHVQHSKALAIFYGLCWSFEIELNLRYCGDKGDGGGICAHPEEKSSFFDTMLSICPILLFNMAEYC